MKDHESFDEFYLKLSTIINQAAEIGHNFGSLTIIRKIMKIIPRARFGSKIDVIIENNPDLNRVTVSTLVSKHRAHEAAIEIAQVDEPKKDKTIGFSSILEDDDILDKDDWTENDIEFIDDQIALLSQKVKRMMMLKNKVTLRGNVKTSSRSKLPFYERSKLNSGNENIMFKGKEKSEINVTCYKCG